ncbi:MAG: LytTR family DNA-binding domain-containing protein [Bacteroidales bacterium]|nr:LytTR family DNA-binding domain-containing protein [Bacteroidales bacterium]
MQGFLNKTYPFEFSIRKRLLFAIWGAIAFFLFILFFQPFGISQTNLNNYILLIAGFGGIAFIVYCLLHLPTPWKRISLRLGQYNLNIMFVFELLIWILNAVAFSFYLRYVGHVNLSIFLVFRIALITLFQLIINMMIYEIYDLNIKLATAGESERAEQKPSPSKDRDEDIYFTSTTGAEKLKFKHKDIVLIKAAENYVEFYYIDSGTLKRKLLRSTLRSIEEQLRTRHSFIRCHRNCIVNITKVEKLKSSPAGALLILNNYNEEVTVSRQYLLQVRTAIENRP